MPHHMPNPSGQEPGSYLRHTPLLLFSHCTPSSPYWSLSQIMYIFQRSLICSLLPNPTLHSSRDSSNNSSYLTCTSVSSVLLAVCQSEHPSPWFKTLWCFLTASWNKFTFLNKTLRNLLLAHLNVCPETRLCSGERHRLRSQTIRMQFHHLQAE